MLDRQLKAIRAAFGVLFLVCAAASALADTQADYIEDAKAAIAAMNAGDTEKAFPHLDKCIKSGKFFGDDQATLLNYRGVVYHQRKDYDKAIGDFSEAIFHNPKVANFYGNRADAKAAKGDKAGAAADNAIADRLRAGGTAPAAAPSASAAAPAPAAPKSIYGTGKMLVSGMNGKCVDVPEGKFSQGTMLHMWDCVPGHQNQTFELTPDHAIKVADLCMNGYGTAAGNGVPGDVVGLGRCNGMVHQQWRYEGGLIKGKNGLCLDVAGANTNNGAALILWNCVAGAPNQQWSVSGPAATP
jgi:tetratricopeptide (TPR) repeat protein